MKKGNGSGGWRSNLSGLGASLRRHRRLWIFIGVPLAIILVIAYAIAFLIDEPLRRYTEAKMNRALKGYTVRIKKLDFHPHGFSLDLKGLTLVQDRSYPGQGAGVAGGAGGDLSAQGQRVPSPSG